MHASRCLLPGLFVLLVACAAPTRQPPTVPAGKMFRGSYIDVKAPSSDGWIYLGSSPQGMAFAKQGLPPGESLTATVMMFDLQPTQTPEDLVRLVKEGIEKDTNSQRFASIESKTDYTAQRTYPCVRHHALANDKEAVTSPTTKEPLLLEIQGLYCRHPIRTDTGFAAIYSYRGRSRYPALGAEAQDFIEGVQVPSGKP